MTSTILRPMMKAAICSLARVERELRLIEQGADAEGTFRYCGALLNP